MKRKKLIPRPETSKIKFITSWGYSFQNGGDIPILEKGGRIGNFSLLYQEGGTIGKRTDRTGVMENKFERPGGVKVKTVYKGTRMDHPEVKSNYVRGGGSQTQETIDKNYQLMKSIREKHRNVKTQDEVVKMLQEGKLKPYEAQLLVQAIANERSDALGAKGFEGINYKKGEFFDDEESGLKFKIGDNGRVYTLRNKLNAYLQERAKAGDKDYKGWENLSGDMEYETGLFGKQKTQDDNKAIRVEILRTGISGGVHTSMTIYIEEGQVVNGEFVGGGKKSKISIDAKRFDATGLEEGSHVIEGAANISKFYETLRSAGAQWRQDKKELDFDMNSVYNTHLKQLISQLVYTIINEERSLRGKDSEVARTTEQVINELGIKDLRTLTQKRNEVIAEVKRRLLGGGNSIARK